jgi:hypothetical protein
MQAPDRQHTQGKQPEIPSSGKASSKRLDDDAVPIVEQVDFTAEMNHRQKFVQWSELKEMLQVIR